MSPHLRVAFVLTLLGACGAPRPEPPRAAQVAAEPIHAEPEAPAPSALPLACGRARAALPAGWAITSAQSCINPGYPMDIEADGIAGGASRHELTSDGCTLELEVDEDLDASADASGEIVTEAAGAGVSLATPEGTTLECDVRSAEPACAARAEPLLRAMIETLEVPAIRATTSRATADVTSAGHAITIELPAGFWLITTGGAADQWETSYRLEGPGPAFAMLYTAWSMEFGGEEYDASSFEPRVLAPSRGWRERVDPIRDDDEPCRATYALGPEPRIETAVYLCGPPSGHEALLEVLRAARFTPPRP